MFGVLQTFAAPLTNDSDAQEADTTQKHGRPTADIRSFGLPCCSDHRSGRPHLGCHPTFWIGWAIRTSARLQTLDKAQL